MDNITLSLDDIDMSEKGVFSYYQPESCISKNELLTERETEVLQLICEQKSSTEIGEVLNISSRTVDGHRNNLLSKTDSKNVVGLVVFAIQNNLVLI